MNKVYIITITDGNINSLEYTLRSIDKQSVSFHKNIIISKNKLNNLDDKFKNEKRIFIYKKNSSIYQAMNVGLKKVKNNCLIFLNAGDKFFSKTSLEKIYCYLKKYNFKTCLMFVSILKNNNNYFIPKKKTFLSTDFLTHSSFVRPPIIKDFGFNEKNKVTADGKWMSDNVKKFKVKKIYAPLTIFSLGGISNLPSKKSLIMKLNMGIIIISKELLKFILLKMVGTNLFYKIIYSFKYDMVNYNKISKFFRKSVQ